MRLILRALFKAPFFVSSVSLKELIACAILWQTEGEVENLKADSACQSQEVKKSRCSLNLEKERKDGWFG